MSKNFTLRNLLFSAVIVMAAGLTSCKDDEEATVSCISCDGTEAFCAGEEDPDSCQTFTNEEIESLAESLNALGSDCVITKK